jgi:NADH-quinone oxidoreductase subunit L
MPLTFLVTWVGTLALVGFPGFSGFFSKDAIIEAVHHSQLPGSGFAYVAVTAGVFVTAFYSFRMLFLAFYGKPRMDEHTRHHLKESPFVVVLPLLLLALPSAIIGAFYIEPMLFKGFFGSAIKVSAQHDTLAALGRDFESVGHFIAHGLQSLPMLLVAAGFGLAWFLYIHSPQWPDLIRRRLNVLYAILMRKYGFDDFNETVLAAGARGVGRLFWQIGDVKLIDGLMVNGSARVVGWMSAALRHVQSGYVYHYAFAMIIGLFLLMTFFLHV